MKHSDQEILQFFFQPATQEKGFAMLMNTFQQQLYAQIWRITLNENDTDDILQNTFVKAWKGLPNFKGESQLSTWLYRIAQNETYTFMQKKNKKATIAFNTEYVTTEPITSAQHYSETEIEQKFQNALAQLPDKQREVFCLRYYDEMPYQEMSKLLGTSEGALKASYHIAAQKIEKYLLQ